MRTKSIIGGTQAARTGFPRRDRGGEADFASDIRTGDIRGGQRGGGAFGSGWSPSDKEELVHCVTVALCGPDAGSGELALDEIGCGPAALRDSLAGARAARVPGKEGVSYGLGSMRRSVTPIGRTADPVIVLLLIQNAAPGREGLDGHSLPPGILQAIRTSASDAMGTPRGEFLASIARALDTPAQSVQTASLGRNAAVFTNLTPRQREIMDLVLAGHPNKIIAADLGISQRTVENHRASIMKKTGAKSLPALVRLAMLAGQMGNSTRTSQH